MKKLFLTLIASATVLTFTACAQEEPPTVEAPFPTAESVNLMIENLGEVTDIESAAQVSLILEEYQALDELSQAKVSNIQKVIDSVKTATTFLDEDDMKISVMSFNIRYGEWGIGRQDLVFQLIEQEDPDIFGVQEANPQWVNTLNSRLIYEGSKYGMSGEGRDYNKGGERTFVFYKKDKFNLLETKTLWLSDTPEVYSRYPDADDRILTYQLLERKADGQIFLHLNTHLCLTVAGRLDQARMITSWIEENFGNKYPVIITGDFNCNASSEEFSIFTDAGYEVTNTYGESTRTYQGYNDNPEAGDIIDFIFVNNMIRPISYKVCQGKINDQWISDHNAIVSEVLIIPTYDSIEFPEEE